MNGEIASIEVGYGLFPDFSASPYIPPGEQVKLRVNWSAQADNTNWTSALVAYKHLDPIWEILDEQTQRHIFASDSGTTILNLFNMPDSIITFAVVLWGHPDYLLGSFPAGRNDWVQLDYKTIVVFPEEVMPELDFDLAKPWSSEASVDPGTPITLTCPVTSRCSATVNAQIRVKIYEGSLFLGHGDQIAEYRSDIFEIRQNQTKNIVINHTTVEGTIDRRDVEVEVYVDSQLVKESEWDDVYYVTEVPPEYDFRIVVKELEIMGEGRYPIPAAPIIQADSKAKVWVEVRNTGYVGGHPRVKWEVRDPDDIMVTIYDHTAFEMISPGEEHKFYEAIETFTLRKEGKYTIKIELLAEESGSEIHDSWQGMLCKVGVIPPPSGCQVDADCPAGYICVGGVCVPEQPVVCQTDADCPPGFVCVDGKCIQEEGEFPVLPIALIGAGAVILALSAKKPKK